MYCAICFHVIDGEKRELPDDNPDENADTGPAYAHVECYEEAEAMSDD